MIESLNQDHCRMSVDLVRIATFDYMIDTTILIDI